MAARTAPRRTTTTRTQTTPRTRAAQPPAAPTDETAPRTPAPRGPRVGSVVTLKSDDDTAPAAYGLVVATVDGTEHRPEGVHVIRLPEPTFLEADQVEHG